MKGKWINAAVSLLLVVVVLVGACSEAGSPPTATPAPTVAPTAKITSVPTVPPTAKATPAPTVAPVAKATPAPVAKATPAAPPAPKPTSKPLSKSAPPPKPEKVVALVESFGQEAFMPNGDSQQAYSQLPNYESLWDMEPATRQLRPMLAETLPEWSQDGKTLFINLRQGVQFHEGYGEMTAEDVKFTIEMVAAPNSVSAGKAAMSRSRVEILGPYKLAVHLQGTDWTWPLENATVSRLILPIVSKKYVEKVGEKEAGRHPIGTGPFKFVRHEVSKELEFEAVPNHWRITPDYKTLVIKLISEPATAIAMLRTGEADIAAVPLSFVPEAKAAGLDIRTIRDVSVIGIALGGQYLPAKETFDPNVPWVLAKEPERALKVRKALNLAVNRQEIIEKVLNGIGDPWPIIAAPVNVQASYDPAWKPYPYDPEQAKRLLAEAGFPNGFSVTMLQFPASGHSTRELAEAVSIYWEKIGIKVTRQQIDLATHRTRQTGRKNAGFAFPAWRNTWDDEMIGAASFFWSKSTGFNIQFEYPELDDLIAKGTNEPDFEKRQKINYEFHKKIYDNYYSVPITREHMTLGVSKRIGDWPLLMANPFVTGYEHIKLK
ncbi:MAG: hypothetical protein HY673_26575 [Chloroflexi bacterium]|nr:hypothetical protein [Chloroflexota bacterium]